MFTNTEIAKLVGFALAGITAVYMLCGCLSSVSATTANMATQSAALAQIAQQQAHQ